MGMKPWQQEKHYIQYLALNSISEEPVVFKGGTYLWFTQGLDRFSEDLDFTASEPLVHDVAEKVSKDLALFGVENKIKRISDNETTLSFRISAKGPLNTAKLDECVVYVEISKREQVSDRTIPVRLDYPPYMLPTKTIPGMSLEEAGAEKVRAILTREKARDVYDLYYLIAKKGIKFDESLTNSKLEYYKMRFSKSVFLKSVLGHREYYERELKSLVFGELPRFGNVNGAISKWIKD